MTVRVERFTGGKGLDTGAPVEVGEIVLDRPDKRNAMTPAMLDAFARAAEELARDDAVRAIVVRGEGKAFCAGFDLRLCHAEPAALGDLLRGLARAIGALRRSAKPVVIGAHGAAVAGATALLTAADLVVADMACTIGYPVVRLGISPAVSAPTLERMIGAGAARERLLDPEPIDADRARHLGLVHILVPVPEDVTPRTQNEAVRLAMKPPGAVAATKRWLNEVDGSGDEAFIERALGVSLALAGSPEQRERLGKLWAT